MALSLNPLAAAGEQVTTVTTAVTDMLDLAMERSDEFRFAAQSNLSQLASFRVPNLADGNAPVPPSIATSIVGSFDLPALTEASFGEVTIPADPGLDTLVDVEPAAPVTFEQFMPSLTGLVIPEAPAERDLGEMPLKPVLSDVAVPVAPTLVKPLFPSLNAIAIPAFTFPTLPTYTGVAPEFEGTAVSTVLQWTEPVYAVEILDELTNKLRAMWDGELGLPPAVEQALWERAASREDLAIARDISAAMTEFSSRGFTMPPGMLAARTDAIREEGQIKKLALGREILVKIADTQIENLRFACQQAVGAETLLFNIFSNMVQREFEAAKIQLDSQLAMYNAQVALFNARQSAYATEAQVFKTRLDAELARIEVYKAELEGELAKGTLNEQQVRIYGEQIKALLTDVELYKAQMQGAEIEAGLVRNRIDIFKAEVEAYAEQVQADKVRFDAYESRVRGESAKAGILDAEARAYTAYIQGKATEADIGIKNMDAVIRSNELKIRKYAAQLEYQRGVVEAQRATVQANAAAHQANTARFTASVGAEEAATRLEITATEAQSRLAVSLYDTQTRKYMADLEQMIRVAGLQLEALKGAAQASSTLAAGAMAGVSVGASISGSGGISASGQLSESRSWNRGVQGTKSWEAAATDAGPSFDNIINGG